MGTQEIQSINETHERGGILRIPLCLGACDLFLYSIRQYGNDGVSIYEKYEALGFINEMDARLSEITDS